MFEIMRPIAEFLQMVLPGWVRMPNLTFVLPHAAYWLGLLLFPPLAMYLVKRSAEHSVPGRVSLPISYLLWFWGGFVGLHRFYLRVTKEGFVYIALFLLVLYGNRQGKVARNFESESHNLLQDAQFQLERFGKLVEQGQEGAVAQLAAAKEALVAAQQHMTDASLALDQWAAFAGGFAAIILILLIIDAVRIPGLVERCVAREGVQAVDKEILVIERGPRPDPRNRISTPLTRAVGMASSWSGKFVAYWSIIAVFVYYYEVIARYVFNSPTNWAHESMFLMFGMQYLLSGAYALYEDAHVRVDVVYERFSLRTRTVIDVVTSFFFFVFTVTLLLTGFLFAWDSVNVLEVSFTEWAIQYWPVKMTIGLGALLITLQGFARLIRDVRFLLGANRA